MKGLSLFGQARFYDNFIDTIADGGAEGIQNQIIRIAGSHQGEHLRQVHKQDNERGGQERSPEFALLLPQLRQEKPKGMNMTTFPARLMKAWVLSPP